MSLVLLGCRCIFYFAKVVLNVLFIICLYWQALMSICFRKCIDQILNNFRIEHFYFLDLTRIT